MTVTILRKALGILGLVTFVFILSTGCQTAVSDAPIPPTLAAVTFVARAEPAETAAPTNAPPTATIPPLPTATPAPLTIGFDTAVPEELKTAVETLLQAQPTQFVLTEADADLVLGVQAETPIAEWIFAVAAPFPTLADDISLAEVQAAWANGALLLTPAMEAILRSWWGAPAAAATIVAPELLVQTLWQTQTGFDEPILTIVPFEQLTPRLKVLAVDGNSPISVDYDQASYSLKLPLGWVGEETAVSQIKSLWPESMTNRHDELLTHLAMTGPSGLSRAVADRMEKYGYQYPGEEIAPILQSADIAHMSHENAFAPDCPNPTPTGGTTFCAQPKTIQLMTWLGVDVVELTGNHLNDWGRQNLLYTLDLYDEVGIAGYGGGRNLDVARQPLLIENNGNKIAFVGCNAAGPWGVWAREDQPGAMPCDDYSASIAQIQALAAQGYVVVGSIQFIEHFQYDVFQPQRDAFMGFANAGASIVHGAHGHHPMGFAFSGDHFVHYGTGNTFADQMFSLGTRQMFVDTYVIYDGRLIGTELWTGMIEDYARPRKMTAEERIQLLQSVFDASDFTLGK